MCIHSVSDSNFKVMQRKIMNCMGIFRSPVSVFWLFIFPFILAMPYLGGGGTSFGSINPLATHS